jgi:hypothetical protein
LINNDFIWQQLLPLAIGETNCPSPDGAADHTSQPILPQQQLLPISLWRDVTDGFVGNLEEFFGEPRTIPSLIIGRVLINHCHCR